MRTTAIAATTYLTLFIIGLLTPARGSKGDYLAPSKSAPIVHTATKAGTK